MSNIKIEGSKTLTTDEKLHIRQLIAANRVKHKLVKGDVILGRRGRSNTLDKRLSNTKSYQELTELESLKYDMKIFLDYVINDCCVCVEKECIVTNINVFAPTFYANFIESKFNGTPSKRSCSVIGDINIQTKEFVGEDGPIIIDKILDIFQTWGLLSYNSNVSRYYLLNGNKKLSWKNIKQLDVKYVWSFIDKFPDSYVELYKMFSNASPSKWVVSNFVMYIKYLFWYFRKAIVDTTTRYIVKDTKVTAISVGSTNVDSDYDITLYGDNHNVYKTINAFNAKILGMFNTDPDVVFDTNMYGVSFIKSGGDYQCGSNSFSLVKNQQSLSDDFFVLQNIWAIIKVVCKLNEVQKTDEGLHELLLSTLQNTDNTNLSMILQIAEMFVNKYEPSPHLYDKIVKGIERIKVDSEEYSNYISFVNYNGLETYFTMGAFLNVVVNGQMCKEQNDPDAEKITLSIHEYYDSTIENIADLMVHYNKEKYLVRARLSLRKLASKLSSQGQERVVKMMNLLDQIASLQSQCKRVDTLVNCSKFLLMNTCMQCIKEVSEVYFTEIDDGFVDKGIEKFETYILKFPTRNMLEGVALSESMEDLISRLSPTKV